MSTNQTETEREIEEGQLARGRRTDRKQQKQK